MIYDPYHEQELSRLEHILANAHFGKRSDRRMVQNRIEELLRVIGDRPESKPEGELNKDEKIKELDDLPEDLLNAYGPAIHGFPDNGYLEKF